MDRIINNSKNTKTVLFKEFEYLDLFPYSIALILLIAGTYILNAFVTLSQTMH